MIYCVEDDESIRELMIYALTTAGMETRGFSESTAFYEALKSGKPDLVILDIMLPGEDGISILKKLRRSAQTVAIPVIMATAKGSEYEKVIGLDLGADDYLVKPFGMMEMISRIRAVLRRTASPQASDLLTAGSIELNKAKHLVSTPSGRIQLTLKEYDMLQLFMENQGQVFTREQLLDSIWGNDFPGITRTVDVHVGTLRTKLGEYGDCIKTIRGLGYCMEDTL